MAEVDCSSRPPLASDLSLMEEGKTTISLDSPEIVVSATNAHKLAGTYVIIFAAGCGCIVVDKRYHITIMGVAMAWGLAVMVPAYVASQFAGSTLAILTLVMAFHNHVKIGATVTQHLGPTTVFEAPAWEFIISFILMLTICGVATDNRAINELSGITVGATVLFNYLLAGKITGASMNPARSIGPALVSGEFHSLWFYIVAPILGTTTATWIYSLLWLPLPERFDKDGPKIE